ncbi:PadR family transcriptional regulator [Erythrobacter sp.]|uniref:PadR family transcriptional regulator n=1 Tax=Erythrobacter sp. TaxID=1042 RepID=UPI00311F5A31
MRKGILELVVMSILAEREHYGYELVEKLGARCGIEVSDGTIYTILLRLKGEDFVTQRWVTLPKGPARKYFCLTDSGREALREMQKLWAGITSAVSHSGGEV